MDRGITWSYEAIEDIQSIADYISRDSEFYARAVIAKILTLPHQIVEQPFLGRVVPELNRAEIRERFVYSYRLVYEVSDDHITVLAVIHGKRLLENSLSARF